MSSYEDLLLFMFQELRQAGFSLGLTDYLLIVEALHMGLGFQDTNALRNLCRLLWAKSSEDLKTVDTMFHLYVEPYLTTSTPLASALTGDIPFSLPEIPLSSNTSSPLIHDLETVYEQQSSLQEIPFHVLFSQSEEMFTAHLANTPVTKTYHFQPRLPFDQRELTEACRHLRRPQRLGTMEELDVESTIQLICQAGLFLGPVLRPRRRNQARLLLLLDQQGSMVPFSPLTSALIESIFRCNLCDETRLHHFHDCPEDVLYEEAQLAAPRKLTEVLTEQVKRDAVLIVSDAGAARGHYSPQRVADTKKFIQILSLYTYLFVWVNPLPPERWISTTAEDIAHFVPMFPLTREGMHDAIGVLQGHSYRLE